MRKGVLYVVSAFVGAIGLAAPAVGDFLLAALTGAGLGLAFAFMCHAYPDDIAPPADRRHQNTQRRKAAAKR